MDTFRMGSGATGPNEFLVPFSRRKKQFSVLLTVLVVSALPLAPGDNVGGVA